MSTESALDYDGPLSTYTEWHALVVGLTVGALVGWSQSLRRDLRHEPHYAVGGLLVGALVAFVVQR